MYGPGMRELIARKISLLAIPRDSGGGVQEAVDFLSNPKLISKYAKEAEAWVREAIKILKEAPGENPYTLMSDEDVAAEILRRAKHKDRINRPRKG